MFTGIIKELGIVSKIINKAVDLEIEISSSQLIRNLKAGDSVSVNGCCLTVKQYSKSTFTCDVSSSTLKNTSFKYVKTGDMVNLEDSLTPADKIGGHFVSGHTDCSVKILAISKISSSNSYKFKIEMLSELLPYITPRGSISVDGISLTVTEAVADYFSVTIIPYTYNSTNLKFKKILNYVNIEVDLISRYIAQILINSDLINTNYNLSNRDSKNLRDKSTFLSNYLKESKDKTLKEKLLKYGFYK